MVDGDSSSGCRADESRSRRKDTFFKAQAVGLCEARHHNDGSQILFCWSSVCDCEVRYAAENQQNVNKSDLQQPQRTTQSYNTTRINKKH